MNKKIFGIIVSLLTISLIVTPFAFAKPWGYPKNNEKWEEFGVTYGFDFSGLIGGTYAATAGFDSMNKVVVAWDEVAVSYEIRIGEAGPSQRVYNLWDGMTGDFAYSGVATFTCWDPILPYVFDPMDPVGTLFLAGRMHHFRVDYMYDFSAVQGGLEGTLTMVALVTGNGQMLIDANPMFITSLQGTGDFKNVQILSSTGPMTHVGIVSGWPE
jgi:hypothetical protein